MAENRSIFVCASLAALLISVSPLAGFASNSGRVAYRTYFVDVALFSFVPGEGIESYRSHGGGGAAPNSSVGLGVANDHRQFQVDIEPALKSQRFITMVTVEPKGDDAETEAQTFEYDLSDFRPETIEIARDDDGRVYRLNLMPRGVEHPKPQPFRISDLRLETWSFPSSPVILNDQDYLGRLGASYGQLAWIDVPGLATIKFSLLRMKDSHAWGTLTDGTVNITHPDGTTFRISNVLNGRHRQVLEGGPYQVWVRWSEPTHSVEEYRRMLKDRIATLKERAADGDLSARPEVLKRLEEMSESDRPTLMSSGVKALSSAELADELVDED